MTGEIRQHVGPAERFFAPRLLPQDRNVCLGFELQSFGLVCGGGGAAGGVGDDKDAVRVRREFRGGAQFGEFEEVSGVQGRAVGGAEGVVFVEDEGFDFYGDLGLTGA